MTVKYGDSEIRNGNEHCEALHVGRRRDSKQLLKFYLFRNKNNNSAFFVCNEICCFNKKRNNYSVLPQALSLEFSVGFFSSF